MDKIEQLKKQIEAIKIAPILQRMGATELALNMAIDVVVDLHKRLKKLEEERCQNQ